MKKSLAILGGMGPEASEYMYKVLIQMATQKFNAKNNDQFPDIVLFSVPVPDFISDESSKNAALEMLKIKVKSTDPNSILCFSIACNTAHSLINDLQQCTEIPFVSMVDETVKKIKEGKFTKVGLMGTPMTIKTGLYSKDLNQNSIETILPNSNQIDQLEKIIRNVIAGNNGVNDSQELLEIADSLSERGAEAIVLGCTELPLVFPKKYKLPVINPTILLAEVLLQKYYQQNTIGAS